MSTIITPITTPFASGRTSGTKPNVTPPLIPNVPDIIMNQTTGIPLLQSTPLNAGGVTCKEAEMNGTLNFYTNLLFQQGQGYQYTFDSTLSATIGGYAQGAILWCASNNTYQRSLINNNTFNFIATPSYINDGVHWSNVSLPDIKDNNAGAVTIQQPSGASANLNVTGYLNTTGVITGTGGYLGSGGAVPTFPTAGTSDNRGAVLGNITISSVAEALYNYPTGGLLTAFYVTDKSTGYKFVTVSAFGLLISGVTQVVPLSSFGIGIGSVIHPGGGAGYGSGFSQLSCVITTHIGQGHIEINVPSASGGTQTNTNFTIAFTAN